MAIKINVLDPEQPGVELSKIECGLKREGLNNYFSDNLDQSLLCQLEIAISRTWGQSTVVELKAQGVIPGYLSVRDSRKTLMGIIPFLGGKVSTCGVINGNQTPTITLALCNVNASIESSYKRIFKVPTGIYNTIDLSLIKLTYNQSTSELSYSGGPKSPETIFVVVHSGYLNTLLLRKNTSMQWPYSHLTKIDRNAFLKGSSEHSVFVNELDNYIKL